MKKLMALVLGLVFVGSMVMVIGCTPKQEAQQAPAMEEAAPAGNTPAAEQAAPAQQAPEAPAK